jgi:hypothetical protein
MPSVPDLIPLRGLKLSSSALWVAAGHSLSLSWEVPGSGAASVNVQLACSGEAGLEMIESVSRQGTIQMIFSRPGMVTFTLTASFGDGVKQSKQIQIQVGSLGIIA